MTQMTPDKYKIEHIEFLDTYRRLGTNWDDILVMFNEEFCPGMNNYTKIMLQHAYARYKYLLTRDAKEVEKTSELDAIKSKFVNQMQKTKVIKENKLLVDNVLSQDQFLDAIKLLVKDLKTLKINKLDKIKPSKNKHNKIWNILLSDIHNGKIVERHNLDNTKTETFNNEIFKKRIQELAKVFIIKIQQDQAFFNVEKIMVSMMGDFIENSIMHGTESSVGCEYENSEQIMNCIKILYTDFIIPLSQLNIHLEFNCVTGNHDRISEHKTYNTPGKANSTWIIYNTLQMLCEANNIGSTWNISADNFLVVKVYGEYMLLEHGDEFKGLSERAFIEATRKREAQLNIKIRYTRIGHFHSYTHFGLGQYISNLSLVGQDDYALNKGYNSVAGQVIESFLDVENRDKYYDTFVIQLDHIL